MLLVARAGPLSLTVIAVAAIAAWVICKLNGVPIVWPSMMHAGGG